MVAGTDNGAVMEGYTRHVIVSHGGYSAAVLVKPDTDFDTRFKAFDTDEQEWGYFNGWTCDIEDIEE